MQCALCARFKYFFFFFTLLFFLLCPVLRFKDFDKRRLLLFWTGETISDNQYYISEFNSINFLRISSISQREDSFRFCSPCNAACTYPFICLSIHLSVCLSTHLFHFFTCPFFPFLFHPCTIRKQLAPLRSARAAAHRSSLPGY